MSIDDVNYSFYLKNIDCMSVSIRKAREMRRIREAAKRENEARELTRQKIRAVQEMTEHENFKVIRSEVNGRTVFSAVKI